MNAVTKMAGILLSTGAMILPLSQANAMTTGDRNALGRLNGHAARITAAFNAIQKCHDDICFEQHGRGLERTASDAAFSTVKLMSVATTPCVIRTLRFAEDWMLSMQRIGLATEFANVKLYSRTLKVVVKQAANARRVRSLCHA